MERGWREARGEARGAAWGVVGRGARRGAVVTSSLALDAASGLQHKAVERVAYTVLCRRPGQPAGRPEGSTFISIHTT